MVMENDSGRHHIGFTRFVLEGVWRMMENEVLQIAALVAAYVGVIKGLGLPDRFAPLAALLVSSVFVFAPDAVQDKIALVSIIGLTASGAYQYVKKQSGGKDA